MSSSIQEPRLKTTARQDIRLISEILRLCEQHSIPAPGLVLHLRSVNDILDGKPIDADPTDFSEAVRSRLFGKYVTATSDFLVAAMLCTLEPHLIDSGMRSPIPVSYIRVTRFGKLFAFLPFCVQVVLLKLIHTSLFAVAALKKYRWIFSTTSMCVGAFTWARTHELSALAIALVLTAGAAAAFFMAWLVKILNISSDA